MRCSPLHSCIAIECIELLVPVATPKMRHPASQV